MKEIARAQGLLLVKSENQLEQNKIDRIRYLLDHITHDIEKLAKENNVDYITFGMPLKSEATYTLIVAAKKNKQGTYSKGVFAVDRKTRQLLKHADIYELRNLARDTTFTTYMTKPKLRSNDLSFGEDVDVLLKRELDKQDYNDKNKQLPLNFRIIVSQKGFIIGDILPIIKSDIAYKKNTYDSMLQCHIAVYNNKEYEFMTFYNDYGIAPAEIIQDDIISNPEEHNMTFIRKTIIKVSKENGIPMIDDKPINRHKLQGRHIIPEASDIKIKDEILALRDTKRQIQQIKTDMSNDKSKNYDNPEFF